MRVKNIIFKNKSYWLKFYYYYNLFFNFFGNLQFIDPSSAESHSLDFDGPQMFT